MTNTQPIWQPISILPTIAQLINDNLDETLVPTIGITGGSASGKTTIAESFAKALSKDSKKVCILSLDRYLLEDDKISPELYRPKLGEFNYDHPDTLDLLQASTDIVSLKQGKTVRVPQFWWKNKKKSSSFETIGPCQFLIVEGIHAFYLEELRKSYHLKIFVDHPAKERLERRKFRDKSEREISYEVTARNFEERVEPMFKEWIDNQRQNADYIMSGNDTKDENEINRLIKILRRKAFDSLRSKI